jgi:hypothetical protein
LVSAWTCTWISLSLISKHREVRLKKMFLTITQINDLTRPNHSHFKQEFYLMNSAYEGNLATLYGCEKSRNLRHKNEAAGQPRKTSEQRARSRIRTEAGTKSGGGQRENPSAQEQERAAKPKRLQAWESLARATESRPGKIDFSLARHERRPTEQEITSSTENTTGCCRSWQENEQKLRPRRHRSEARHEGKRNTLGSARTQKSSDIKISSGKQRPALRKLERAWAQTWTKLPHTQRWTQIWSRELVNTQQNGNDNQRTKMRDLLYKNKILYNLRCHRSPSLIWFIKI